MTIQTVPGTEPDTLYALNMGWMNLLLFYALQLPYGIGNLFSIGPPAYAADL